MSFSLLADQWRMADWRALSTEMPWNDHDFVVLGQTSGKGGTRPRVQAYEVYIHGRLVAVRHKLSEAKEYIEARHGPLTWTEHRTEPMRVVHYTLGETDEFGSPTLYWVGMDSST